MNSMSSQSEINFVVERINAPEVTKDYFLEFISRLVIYKHKKFIDTLMEMVSKSDCGSDEFWIGGYLYALCQMLERPYRRNDEIISLFVDKLKEFTSERSNAEVEWYSGTLLGMIDHPDCFNARIEGVNNDNLYIRGRIECLRGIVNFHAPDQVLEIVSRFAFDSSSPLCEIAQLILSDIGS